MKLSILDWSVIAAYFLFNLGIGLYYARRASGSTSEFFLSGRNVPWWLAGTSMVATTRSEEHTSELQSHSFISYAVFCLKKKKKTLERHYGPQTHYTLILYVATNRN